MDFEFIKSIKDFLEYIIKYKGEKKEKYIDAIFLIESAANKTLYHIKTNGYTPSLELSELWLSVAKKMQSYDLELTEKFVAKSNMWAYPERWIEANADESIITLRQIREKAELLRKKI